MDSASQSEIPPEEPPSRLSNFIGVLVAILTLTLPMVVIAHFSSGAIVPADSAPYPFTQQRE